MPVASVVIEKVEKETVLELTSRYILTPSIDGFQYML